MPATTLDLVSNIVDKKPAEVEQNFNELISNRIRQVLDDRKMELASTLFTGEEQPETSEGDDNNENA